MKPLYQAAAALALAATAACVAPVGPVQVTRFHALGAVLGRGAIAVEPAPGEDGASLEYRTYAAAVARQLTLLGYSEQPAGPAVSQVALVRIARSAARPGRAGSPVSVGVGGSAGSYGSGLGVGIGIDLSGPPAEQVSTELAVMIRERASGQSLWEGRSSFSVSAASPLAGSQLGAAKMAEALFKGFPGNSGETIQVR